MYFRAPWALATVCHLMPAGKPAPPRPRRPAFDLDQRFEPLHAPAARALDLVALLGEGRGQFVGAEGAGEGVV